jgi:predicted nucleic acid-binding protein
VSDLVVTEIASAVARRVRQTSFPRDAARRIVNAIVGRLDDGTFQRVELARDVHRHAEHLLLTLTRTPLRAADALHLALARAGRAATMVSFDGRLAAAARAAGLTVHPTAL